MRKKSQVYWTNMRTPQGVSLLDKLEKVIKRAGLSDMDLKDKFVAVKMHFGERGNLAHLRPNWARKVVDMVKKEGGRPFLTDCNTLYVGSRKNALDHLDCAMENGFSPMSVGCQIIIADGLKGTDEVVVDLKGTDYVKHAKIGRAIMDADILITLNHFKGHECSGFGGAIKNLGMGCGSKSGKMEQHRSGKPSIKESMCKKCRQCIKACAHGAISYDDTSLAHIDHNKCVGCGRCIGMCKFDAIYCKDAESNVLLCKKMAEYAMAVVKDKPHFHISIINQVSPYCDCHRENDAPIIPDVGMFASFDPVALDQACADMCNKQPVIAGSMLDDHLKKGIHGHDHFGTTFPNTEWRASLEQAEKMGVGVCDYELIEVK